MIIRYLDPWGWRPWKVLSEPLGLGVLGFRVMQEPDYKKPWAFIRVL